MLIAPIALSTEKLSRQELADDRKSAQSFGNCKLGKKAVYLGWWVLDNIRYIPLSKVERVYKRLAVSKGFYEGRTFGSLSYVVVVYDGGKTAVCQVRNEENVDALLSAVSRGTNIPIGKKS